LNPSSTVKVVAMSDRPTEDAPVVPNHHAGHPGFSGLRGWLGALSMRVGRRGDAEVAIELTGLAAGERLVDVGCGPGVAARVAAERGAIVIGVDPAAVMLAVARRDDRRHAVTWKEGVAEALPLADSSCDVLWSLATVHHWPDLDGALAEVLRVLDSGGRFLAIERRVQPGATGLASHGWTDEQAEAFASMCAAAGFASADVVRRQTKRRDLIGVLAMAAP
jgi:ubiquinone/menaquinone biosynthesis C-methylase UbiE